MSNYPHLDKAPAVEAILDLRASGGDFDGKKFLEVHDQIKDRFPIKEEQQQMELGFMFGGGKVQAQEQSKFIGYRFTSEDKKNVVQFRSDGFSYNRLKPYTKWDQVSSAAYELMKLYIAIRNPVEFTRIAVRYINQFDVDSTMDKVSEFLTMPISLPPKLGHEPQKFVSRISTHDPKSGTKCNILQSVENNIDMPGFRVVLDIDVFRTGNFHPSLEEIKPFFEEIRNIKNDVFFGSIQQNKWRMFT